MAAKLLGHNPGMGIGVKSHPDRCEERRPIATEGREPANAEKSPVFELETMLPKKTSFSFPQTMLMIANVVSDSPYDSQELPSY
jgi:hypothetical protein